MKTTRLSNLASFAAVTLVTVNMLASRPANAAEPTQIGNRLREVVRLSKNPRTKNQALAELGQLQALAPSDARVPYAFALGLMDRLDYRGALTYVKETVRLNPGHLNAWKTRIWLSVATKDFPDALDSMEKLTSLMPKGRVSSEVERTCEQFSGFMGKVFGYLEGPQANAVETLQRASAERRILGQLTAGRKSIFEIGRKQVVAEYAARKKQISSSRDVARQRAAAFRGTRLSQLEKEQGFAYTELDKMEDLRLSQQKISAEERSVIAATSEKSAGRTIAAAGTRFRDAIQKGPFYRRAPNAKKNDKYHLDHNYDRYRSYNHGRGLSSEFATDKGLGRPEYWKSLVEQDKYNKRMDKRQRNLHRRVLRIAKERSQLLQKPNLGSNNLVRAAEAKAKSLKTYIDMPINTGSEALFVLTSYQK